MGTVRGVPVEKDFFRTFAPIQGELPEWSNGPDCKSGGACLRRFESSTPHLRE